MSEVPVIREPWRNRGDPGLNNGVVIEAGTDTDGAIFVKHCPWCISVGDIRARYPGRTVKELSRICFNHYPEFYPPPVGQT